MAHDDPRFPLIREMKSEDLVELLRAYDLVHPILLEDDKAFIREILLCLKLRCKNGSL
jgi:hypothetical protein